MLGHYRLWTVLFYGSVCFKVSLYECDNVPWYIRYLSSYVILSLASFSIEITGNLQHYNECYTWIINFINPGFIHSRTELTTVTFFALTSSFLCASCLCLQTMWRALAASLVCRRTDRINQRWDGTTRRNYSSMSLRKVLDVIWFLWVWGDVLSKRYTGCVQLDGKLKVLKQMSYLLQKNKNLMTIYISLV